MPMPKIRRHKRGNFYMHATFGGKRETIYGRTEEEVEQKYIAKSYEFGMGIKPGQKVTMSDYLRTWLSLKEHDLSPYTYEGYRSNIENHIIPYIGNKVMQDVIPADVQAIYTAKRKERKLIPAEKMKLEAAEKAKTSAKSAADQAAAKKLMDAVNLDLARKRSLSETSMLYIHRILTAAFNDAVRNRRIMLNPMDALKPPKRNKVKKKLPEEASIHTLFTDVRGEEYELGVHLAVACGLRRGEICAVKWTDMNFDNNMLYVNEAIVQTARAGKITKAPKDDDPRDVCVPPGLVRLMKLERKRQDTNSQIMGELYAKNDYMVKHRDGSPFSPYSMSMCINRAIQRLGITTTLHGLRSVYVSIGYKYGADEKAITDSAGHHSVEFNRERYQSVYESMKIDLADKIDTALYKGNEGKEGNVDDKKDE